MRDQQDKYGCLSPNVLCGKKNNVLIAPKFNSLISLNTFQDHMCTLVYGHNVRIVYYLYYVLPCIHRNMLPLKFNL